MDGNSRPLVRMVCECLRTSWHPFPFNLSQTAVKHIVSGFRLNFRLLPPTLKKTKKLKKRSPCETVSGRNERSETHTVLRSATRELPALHADR